MTAVATTRTLAQAIGCGEQLPKRAESNVAGGGALGMTKAHIAYSRHYDTASMAECGQ